MGEFIILSFAFSVCLFFYGHMLIHTCTATRAQKKRQALYMELKIKLIQAHMERKLMSEALQGQGAHLQIVRKRPANAFMIAVISIYILYMVSKN